MIERDWLIVWSKPPRPDKQDREDKRAGRTITQRQSHHPWDTTRDNMVRDLFPTYFAKDVAAVINALYPHERTTVTDKMVVTRAHHLGVPRSQRRSAKSKARYKP